MRFIESNRELYCEKRSRPGSVGGDGGGLNTEPEDWFIIVLYFKLIKVV